MHWPKHVRALILSFRPPWWIDEKLEDFPSSTEWQYWPYAHDHYEDFYNDKWPSESWGLPFYIFGTERSKFSTLSDVVLWQLECLETGEDPRVHMMFV